MYEILFQWKIILSVLHDEGITERALMASVSVRTCVSLYCIAADVGASNLKDYCSGLISAHWDELLPQDFKLMSSPLLHTMLKSKSKHPLHDAIKLKRLDVIQIMLDKEGNEFKVCRYSTLYTFLFIYIVWWFGLHYKAYITILTTK